MKLELTLHPGLTLPTPLVFILGYPLKHSLSPVMQNAAFRALGIPWVYAPLEFRPDQLSQTMENLRAENVQGCNVTVPYKESVLPLLDHLERKTQELGSVNTVYKREGKLFGVSTDGEGFLRSLGTWRKRLPGSKFLLLGAGGSARAVAAAAASSGIKSLYVANRSWGRANQLLRLLRQTHPRLQAGAVSLVEGEKLTSNCDWVVQTTSVGLKPGDPSLLSLKWASPGTLVVDLIYHRETTFLRQAHQKGLPTLNGLGMLLHQGALSFGYWTGQKAPLAVMSRALRRSLASG